MVPRLLQRYREEIVPKLKTEFSYTNLHQVPSVTKVVVNMGMGEATQNPKLIEHAVKAEPENRDAHAARARIYRERRKVESSLMTKGIFRAAARSSEEVVEPEG